MFKKRHYTIEEQTELLNNPYTFRITETKVVFTLEFKQFVMEHINKPDMTARKVFNLAGYRDELFSSGVRRFVIIKIKEEAASPNGLQAPVPVKQHKPRKKHTETEFKELQDRVDKLEQQIDFLKKSQHLKMTDRSNQPNNSS